MAYGYSSGVDEVDRKTLLLFAAEAEIDVRTAKRVLLEGVDTLRASADRARARAAAVKLGLVLP